MFFTLSEYLESLKKTNEKGLYFIEDAEKTIYIPYSKLYEKSLKVLHYLQLSGVKPKQEMVIRIDDNQSFVYIFWACILGGIIPVPVSGGNIEDVNSRTFNIWKVLKDPCLISTRQASEHISYYIKEKNTRDNDICPDFPVLVLEEALSANEPGKIEKALPDDIALIQFSSGSTGEPKGVINSHEVILTNLRASTSALDITEKDSFLYWSPLTHNMGLIFFNIHGVINGINQYVMPTQLFIQNPLLWMKKASEYRITMTGCPNFGFSHLLSYYSEDALKECDLSSIRIIINGAEPISYELCKRFMSILAVHKIKDTVIVPSYGIAEACAAVSFSPYGSEIIQYTLDRNTTTTGNKISDDIPEDKSNCVSFVDVGYPLSSCKMRICDDNDKELDEGYIGHIQLSGRQLSLGYYNDEERTRSVFTPDGWLRTGDLGFIKNNRLIITGRHKDIILLNGKNYYPHDIEAVATELDTISTGDIAVVGVYDSSRHTDEIIVFMAAGEDIADTNLTASMIIRHINKRTSLGVQKIVPISSIPKTVSGKLKRSSLASRYQNGEFKDTVIDIQNLEEKSPTASDSDEPANIFEKKILNLFKKVLRIGKLSVNDNFFELGGNSVATHMLIMEIEKEFDFKLFLSEMYAYPTVCDLSKYIEQNANIKSGNKDKIILEDIIPLHEDTRNCYEDLIASLASWLGRDHQMLYLKDWDFEFDETKGDLLGKCLSPKSDLSTRIDLLHKYHGIKLTEQNCKDAKEALKLIRNEICEGRPVAINLDIFWCPWFQVAYQQYHGQHFCTINGIDSNDNLFCIDSSPMNYGDFLPKEHFLNGFNKYMLTMSVDEDTSHLTGSWQDILRERISYMYEKVNGFNTFEQMINFSKALENCNDIEQEIREFMDTDVFFSHIFVQLQQLYRNRIHFGESLAYLGKKNKIGILEKYASDINRIGFIWNSIYGFIIKACLSSDKAFKKEVSYAAAKKILEIAVLEEEFAQNLLQATYEYDKDYVFENIVINGEELTKDIRENHLLDLKDYLNNRAFSDLGNTRDASFVEDHGRHTYLVADEKIISSAVLKFNDISYKLPEYKSEAFDNILCLGQKIVLDNPGRYKKIFIVGCCDFTSHPTTMLLEYESGLTERSALDFTDYSLNNGFFNESIVWSGSVMETGPDRIDTIPILGKLFAQCYSIPDNDNLQEITLPYCPNMHVFAITLCK
ncbi:MAG: AMP-binding protein [Clostridia bacterium]|nr:AMP-binding protein [Clostridia bacterium]